MSSVAKENTTQFAELIWRARQVRVEYQWVGLDPQTHPIMVFLHEGLGSCAMWRDFPERLCQALGFAGLVYSRPAYGKSTPRLPEEKWLPDFIHQQADEVLPALLDVLDIQQKVYLFGHSDGGSIALLYAAHFPEKVEAIIVLAPHILVEAISISSIESARQTYLNTDLKNRLARYHDDVDSAFWGWNDVWLSEAFRSWNMSQEVAKITCPILAVQGWDDEYGTMAQIDGIAVQASQTQLLKIAECGHSPHKDQPEVLILAVTKFVKNIL